MTDWQKKIIPQKGILRPIINPVIEHWSHLRCSSYTAEWISRVLGIENATSNSLLPGPVWFDLFRPILPQDMRKLFLSKGMSTIMVELSDYKSEDRLEWIKREIAYNKRAPVLLVRTKALHWIAVGGYNDNSKVFYIYDPNIGDVSINTKLPIGNSYILYHDLIGIWSGRWFLKYLAILVTNVNVRTRPSDDVENIYNETVKDW